jgi:murein tripeptide amidase MpaA
MAAASLALGAVAPGQTAERRFDNHRIVQVDVTSVEQIEAIEKLGADILNCHRRPGATDVLVTLEQLEQLRTLGLTPRVLQEDVQGAVDRQKLSAAVVAGVDPFDNFFLAYHPYDGVGGIVWYMNEIVARYPALASMVDVGTTLEGRTIWGLRITSSVLTEKPAVVYFGCEHAREWIASTVPTYFATHLVQNYDIDSSITDLVDNVEFFLIPVFNVDGYIYTWGPDRFWRKNRRDNGNGTFGVDINRNWGVGWGGQGASSDPNSLTYRGTSAFSEPETQALRDFIIAHPNLRASLDVHSYSQLILWPFGYTSALPLDQFIYNEVGSAMRSLIYEVYGRYYAAGPIYTTIYPAAGNSVDWTYVQRGIFSFSYECRDTGAYGFALPADQIVPNNEELLAANLHLANSAWVRSPMRFEYPYGLPAFLSVGQDEIITARIVNQTGSLDVDTPSLHYRYDPVGTFVESPLVMMGGGVYEAVLPATNCFSTPEYFFTAETTTAETVTDPRPAPDPQVYTAAPIRDLDVFFNEPLDADPGWTRGGLWAFGTPTGGGGQQTGFPDPASGHTGGNVFGYNLSGDYTNNMSQYHLSTTAINATGRHGIHLSFWRWLGVELPAYDHAYVRVSTDGANWTTVWENQSEISDSSWILQDIDISAVADDRSTVYLRWTMGATDGALVYCGWNIDDVTLYSTSCPQVHGDFNGDSEVDAADFPPFEVCFSGPDVPRPVGCAVFDFDTDGDVDCADYSNLGQAWTGATTTPAFAPCPEFAAPAATAAGSRYLTVTPAGISTPVAIRVTVADSPCRFWFADFDPDPSLAGIGVARLQDTPVYRPGSAWGTLSIADAGIVPSRTYHVQAQLEDESLSPPAVTTTTFWADLATEYDVVDALDIVAVVDRFRGMRTAPPMQRCDLDPARPNFIIDAIDIVSVVDAFRGLPYPFNTPDLCPP